LGGLGIKEQDVGFDALRVEVARGKSQQRVHVALLQKVSPDCCACGCAPVGTIAAASSVPVARSVSGGPASISRIRPTASASCVVELSKRLALNLRKYPGIQVFYDGCRHDVSKLEDRAATWSVEARQQLRAEAANPVL
jgi:hypothetical protein